MITRTIVYRCLPVVLSITAALLAACGGGGTTTPPTATITSVAVICSPTSIYTSQTAQCSATVNGTGNLSSAVSWSATPTSVGSVSSGGLFQPSGTGTATISATSVADSTKSGSATVTVVAPSTITSISVTCVPASILTNQTSTCSATVQGTGSYSTAVNWQATDGTISSAGVFTPAGAGTAVITAKSSQDSTKSGTASITVAVATSNAEWAWMGGSSRVSGQGVYGSLGVAAPLNAPGARDSSVTWTDQQGNFWLFGGYGYAASGTSGSLNDLWEFNPTTNEWTWISGSSATGAQGVYGTLGVAAARNVPGARYGSVSWTDSSGNLWLFGGTGAAPPAPLNGASLNDLWEFSPITKQWRWVSGSGTAGALGVYGTQGVAAAANVPGARYGQTGWTDQSGNFWLFGGYSFNDLWKFSPITQMWTWISGSGGGAFAAGVYGTLGVAAATNVPGSRFGSVGWTDKNGNLWLFGGAGGPGYYPYSSLFNDLWQYNLATNEWTWESGSRTLNAAGVYGTLGVAAAGNVPGARFSSVPWIDVSGTIWLFGGNGSSGSSNDLWNFDPTTDKWTWMSGGQIGTAAGVYGTLGIASASNVPGGRMSAVGWIDSSGNLWLFGGSGFDSADAEDDLNDLWRCQP